jgi:hypothetical protein
MPMTRAVMVPPMARNIESAKLARKDSTSKTAKYHLRESPLGGKVNEEPAENPENMMMKNGPIRNSSVNARIIRDVQLLPISV